MRSPLVRYLGFGLLALAGLVACGGGDAGPDAGPDARLEGFDEPDDVCPGAPHCASGGDGTLHVGAAARVFTPPITETFTDLDGNGKWSRDEPYDDANGNGRFDGIWLFGGARAANAVESDLEARAVVLRGGDTMVAIVYLDAIGMLGQGGDLQQIEEDPRLRQAGIDLVIAGSTHAHDAVDTVGLWGPSEFESGYVPAYNARVREAAIGAILDAAADLHEVEAHVARAMTLDDPDDPAAGTGSWLRDTRDPVIYDPTLTVVRFVPVDAPDTTVATLVHWANHPESGAFGDDNLKISADWPHWLRTGIEEGVPSLPAGGPDVPGLGGVTVYLQGPLGGQIGSLGRVGVPGPDGEPIFQAGHPKERALGTNLARFTLELLATRAEIVSDLPIRYRTARFHARMDHIGFQVAYLIGLLAPHDAAGYDADEAIGPGNTPWLPLRATYLQVGPLGFVTVPGELHPELWVGGYDCQSWSFGYPCYDDSLPNLPDWERAPAPPYLRDLVLANDGVEYPICLGLAHDYVGYIVPAYNYVLDPSSPYLGRAPGHHYEETYSLGPDVERHVVHPILDLVAWRPR
jgi:hypothetical protein